MRKAGNLKEIGSNGLDFNMIENEFVGLEFDVFKSCSLYSI